MSFTEKHIFCIRPPIIIRFLRGSSGTAAIEMALVFPIFLMVVMGMIAYGIYFGAAHSTQQLAADAARASVAGLDDTERAALAGDFIKYNTSKYALISKDFLKLKAAANELSPDDFVVVITYDASKLPIWNLNVPLPSKIIERSAVVRRGGLQ